MYTLSKSTKSAHRSRRSLSGVDHCQENNPPRVHRGRTPPGSPLIPGLGGREIGAGGLTILWLSHPLDAVNEKDHAPVSVRLATADVGCLGGIRAEVLEGRGVFAGHSLAAQGL
jgi:hypothetical protein